MKFDIDRAMVSVQAFDFPRGTGGEGELRAANMLAESLEKSGWLVARGKTRTGCRPPTMTMILILSLVVESSFAWKALQLSLPGAPRLVRAGWFFAGLLA